MPQLAAVPEDKLMQCVAAIYETMNDFGPALTKEAILLTPLGEELGGSALDQLRVIQVIIREIVFDRDALLRAKIIALASGIQVADKTGVRAMARAHGRTPAAVSKQVIKFADRFNLPPSQYMRSLKDRETYRLANRPRTKS